MAEQDHRGVKQVTQPLLGSTSFEAAPDTLVGIALMDMSKKRPRLVEARAEGRTAAEQCYALAASSHHRLGRLPRSNLLSNMYDTARVIASPTRGSSTKAVPCCFC